jgi:uncharacterized repeat protein (TIGR01451 family)
MHEDGSIEGTYQSPTLALLLTLIVLLGLQECLNVKEATALASQSVMADLSLTAKASHDRIASGSQLIYTVTVSNAGPSQAEAMIDVNNSLNAGTRIISNLTSRSMLCTTETSDLSGPLNCSFFRLAPQDSVVITCIVEVRMPPGSVLSNTVKVTINSTSIVDPDPSNNSAIVSTQILDQRCTLSGTRNISVFGSPSLQCGAVVNYTAPAATGTCSEVKCTPSGTSFARGATTVVCTATDERDVAFISTFNVAVNGLPEVSIDKTSLNLGPVNIRRKPAKNPPSNVFTIENSGCETYSAFLGLSRTGSDVDSGKISKPFDGKFFSLRLMHPDGTETPTPFECNIECPLIVRPEEKKTFRILFSPKIPTVSSTTVGLSAEEVLPDVLTATLKFGGSLAINLTGRLSTAVKLINPVNTRKAPLIGFTRSGNEFLVEYSIYDSNLDVNRATILFLDSAGRAVWEAFTFDITQVLGSKNLIRGQPFTISQRFTGARDRPNVAGVRVTVFDAESSDEASSLP